MSYTYTFRAATDYEKTLWDQMQPIDIDWSKDQDTMNVDMDGDHKLDLWFTNNTSDRGKYLVITYRGSGLPSPSVAYYPKEVGKGVTSPVQEFRFGDANGDGEIDIVAAKTADQSLYTYVIPTSQGTSLLANDNAYLHTDPMYIYLAGEPIGMCKVE